MTLTHWILLFSALCAVLSAAALALQLKRAGYRSEGAPGSDAALLQDAVNRTRADMDRLERTFTAGSEAVRGDVKTSLSAVAAKTEALTRQSYETQLRVAESLHSMREKLSAGDKENAAAVAAAIEKLQLSNEKKLDEMRAAVDEKLTGALNERLDASFQTVSEQLSRVYRSLGEMQELSGGIHTLNRVLAGVKTRGGWAETQLEGLLDQIVPGMYVKNYAPTGGETVEFAVTIPDAAGGAPTYLPVDSKFPMDAYLRLCDAEESEDPGELKAARRALEERILSEAKEVKKYIVPPKTTPFAVLYLATDPLYAEAVSSKSNLADRLHSEYRVMLAGPSTITALLSSLAMGFRSVALNRKADEVMKLLAAAKAQYDKFEENLVSAQKYVDGASKKLYEAQHRNAMIKKSLRSVELPPKAAAETALPSEE